MYAKNDKIYSAYVSKGNSKHEEQFLLFNDFKQWRMTLRHNKKLSTSLGGIMSKCNGDYYLNCLHLFRTNNKHVS